MTSVLLFRLARVVCRRVFEVISKKDGLFYKFKAYFHLKLYIYCVPYISWPLQDLNEVISSILWPVFEDFPSTCRRDEIVGESSCVVPAAFLLLNRSVYLP